MAAARRAATAGDYHDYSLILYPVVPVVIVYLVIFILTKYLKAPREAEVSLENNPSIQATHHLEDVVEDSGNLEKPSSAFKTGNNKEAYKRVGSNRAEAGWPKFPWRRKLSSSNKEPYANHRPARRPSSAATLDYHSRRRSTSSSQYGSRHRGRRKLLPYRLFVPPDAEWRRRKCLEVGLPPPTGKAAKKEPERSLAALGPPDEIDRIIGDGNCLFRAVSKEVTLREADHADLRKRAIRVMSKTHRIRFETKFGVDMNRYIFESEMHKDGTWGTEMEIYALATLLTTQIAVYYRPRGALRFDWYFYAPIFAEIPDTQALAIYLFNKGNHFDRVLTVGPIPPEELERLMRPPEHDEEDDQQDTTVLDELMGWGSGAK